MVVFVDDINMPEPEEYGAQPPVQMLRQMLCASASDPQGGVYDRKRRYWKAVQGCVALLAAAHPGGARSPITARFQRVTHVLNVDAASEDALVHIFGTMFAHFLELYKFDDKVPAIARLPPGRRRLSVS